MTGLSILHTAKQYIYRAVLMYWFQILGGYDIEEKAARAYDLAAIKYWGPSTHINFPVMNQPQYHLCCQFSS